MTLTKQFAAAAFTALIAGAAVPAHAQSKTLGATMDVYVFPAEGQDAAAQSKDEAACYEWAVGNTGSDPFELAKDAQANQQQAQAEQQAASNAGRGAGASGAVRGAAAGALIGEIANDDASEGAAWGAAAGAIRGRRKGRQAQQQAQAQASNNAQQREAATAEQLENFKKAFSVCLEAKEYLVKY
ncbi:MAG: glycine zipper domain-containing protein [Pseudomonadota bacterium]